MSHQILRPIVGTALAFAVLLSAPAVDAWNPYGGARLDTRMNHSRPGPVIRYQVFPRHFRDRRHLHRRLQQRHAPAIVPLPHGSVLSHRPIGKSRRHHRRHRHQQLHPRHNLGTVIILGGNGASYSYFSRR